MFVFKFVILQFNFTQNLLTLNIIFFNLVSADIDAKHAMSVFVYKLCSLVNY